MKKLMNECMKILDKLAEDLKEERSTWISLQYDGETFSAFVEDEAPSDGVPFEHHGKTPEAALKKLLKNLQQQLEKQTEWLNSEEYKNLKRKIWG